MCKCLNQKRSGILKPHSLHIMMFGDCLSSDCQFYYKKKGLQVGCMRQVLGPSALGRPRGIGVEREVEGGIRMGNTCKSMADSCQ